LADQAMTLVHKQTTAKLVARTQIAEGPQCVIVAANGSEVSLQ